MAYYVNVTSTATTDGTSTSIAPGGLAKGHVLEIMANDAGGWVNVVGGTASASGADCIYIPADAWVVITSHGTTLNGIRDTTTNVTFIVATLAGTPS